MIRTVFKIWLLLLQVCVSFGQEVTHSFYYPLHIGDLWEYVQYPGFQETVKVIGDTVRSNGHSYFIVKHEAFGFEQLSQQRISDKNELFEISQFRSEERLRFKLNLKVGDIWNFALNVSDSGFYKVTYLADTTLWARELKYAVIEDFTLPDSARPIAPNNYYLADSIGIFFHGFEAGFSQLKGALINSRQFGVITNVAPETHNLPANFVLKQNYPNPFNAETQIEFELPEPTSVAIRVYNTVGQEVRTLELNLLKAGTHSITWDGKNNNGQAVSTGLYIYELQYELDQQVLSLTKKLLLLR